jgi:glycosyltransferase involved in cell wall biosynthesis
MDRGVVDNESEPEIVAVVIPAYSAARTIGATLASVTAQTCPHLDIIVVDDGSTDKTTDIVRHHGARDRPIRLIGQPNQGVATARNRGVAASMS